MNDWLTDPAPLPDDAMRGRIEAGLCFLENTLSVFEDGIRNWDEALPALSEPGTPQRPRRWGVDDGKSETVGALLTSRYGTYYWWAVGETIKPEGSLARAYSNGRMTEDQQERFQGCLTIHSRIEPEVERRGLATPWPPESTARSE
jgi:hypothetical protein